MRRLLGAMVLAFPLLLPLAGSVDAQGRGSEPPHGWLFGSWTGGIFPATETEGFRCFAQPTVIFGQDLVMRASPLDVAYRQRVIETAAANTGGVQFRFTPIVAQGGPLAGGVPPDFGFGCPGGPDSLVVERRGPDEIVFPNCRDFPSPLRRCH